MTQDEIYGPDGVPTRARANTALYRIESGRGTREPWKRYRAERSRR